MIATMRSRNYKTLTAAISGAIAEEKLKGSRLRINHKIKEQDQFRQDRNIGLQCQKCGKMGHHRRDCRTSRCANRLLAKAEKPAGVNTVEKYCTCYKKAGYKREELLVIKWMSWEGTDNATERNL